MSRRLPLAGVGLWWALLGLSTSGPAAASFSTAPQIGQGSISSAVLAPPTAVSATGGCQTLIVGPQMTLAWTATTSTYATAYKVLRSTTTGGPYTMIATVAGGSTTGYTDTTVSGLGATYYYVVESSYSNWTSVNSAQAKGTTPVLCL